MSPRARTTLIAGSAAAVTLLLAAVVVFFVVRSDWMREQFRLKIIEQAETASGGRVEIGAFQFDWSTLTAELDNVSIYGTEARDQAPLLAVKRVLVGFRILSLLKRQFDVSSVAAESPRAHIILQPDGSTNIPRPKTSGRTGFETILDLKIGRFNLADGMVFAEAPAGRRAVAWNASGQKLNLRAAWNNAVGRYNAEVTVEPLRFKWNGFDLVELRVAANASIGKNRMVVKNAALQLPQSRIDLRNLVVSDYASPVITADYSANISLADADRIFKLVNFQHEGTIDISGSARYVSSAEYHVSGAFRGAGVGYGKVRGIRVAGNMVADQDKLVLTRLRAQALGGEMAGEAQVLGLREFRLTGSLEHFDIQTVAQVAGALKLPWDGVVSGPFQAAGKIAEPQYHHLIASATLTVAPAGTGMPVHGLIAAKYDAAANTLDLGPSWLESPGSRVEVAGRFGQELSVKAESRDLNDLAPLLNGKKLPFSLRKGSAAFNGVLAGPLATPRIKGHAEVRNAIAGGQLIESLAGDVTAFNSEFAVTNGAVVLGPLRARIDGSLGLAGWQPVANSPVKANVRIANGDVATLLALSRQGSIPLIGFLNATTEVSGTLGDPHFNADLSISKGRIYGEPFDVLNGHARYVNGGEQLLTTDFEAGRKRLNVTGRFQHAPANYLAGRLTFSASSNAMALNQLALLHKAEPELSGTAQLKADGVIQVDRNQVQLVDLNADLNTTGLALKSRTLGDAHLTAQTRNGILTARLDSNAVKASIHGEGTVALAGSYPVNARMTFSNVGLNAAAALARGKGDFNFDGAAAGEIVMTGSATKPNQITASIDVGQLELHPLSAAVQSLSVRNTGPIRGRLSRSVLTLDSAHFQAPNTDLNLTGTVALAGQSPLNLRLQGNVNLALAQAYNADLTSSGEVNLNTTVRGTYLNPEIAGRAELHQGDFHYADFANGLTNANGVILFNGTRATIESLSAESGGGKVNATGFATLSGGVAAFRVEAKTRGVRVRYPEGVSSVSDADLTFAGTTQRSEASGTVTLRRISINPKSDIPTILASAAQPLRTPEARTGLLSNVNLDVQVETAPDVVFQTSVAQSIEADANLRIRGTAANPAVLGRINITQGELVFFGNKYTINQGTISFFNAARIDPILNVDLETKARGVQVTLTFTGPINNLNLSFRSDPPLQFADIVALLATGRSPTNPTLAIRNTGQSQSLQQIGASALISQAIANPVAGRLQRFFGVSKIKIDPQLTGITGSPEARLTIEQQVTPELLFTYISDVSSTSTQLIRVEWDFNRRWSAILTREENGYVGLDFAFRKRFK